MASNWHTLPPEVIKEENDKFVAFMLENNEFLRSLFADLAEKQQPLGREFTEIWNKHKTELYES